MFLYIIAAAVFIIAFLSIALRFPLPWESKVCRRQPEAPKPAPDPLANIAYRNNGQRIYHISLDVPEGMIQHAKDNGVTFVEYVNMSWNLRKLVEEQAKQGAMLYSVKNGVYSRILVHKDEKTVASDQDELSKMLNESIKRALGVTK